MPYTNGWSEANVHGEAEKFSTNATLQSAMKKPLPNGFFDESPNPWNDWAQYDSHRFEGERQHPHFPVSSHLKKMVEQ